MAEDLRSGLPLSRGVMRVLNLSLTVLFLGLGVVAMLDRRELVSTNLGHRLLLVLSLF